MRGITSRTFSNDRASFLVEDQDRYLDLKTLSGYSSLSVRTLRDYLSDTVNPIPSFCVKRKILVRKSEFDRWMSKHRVDTQGVSRLVDEMAGAFSRAP